MKRILYIYCLIGLFTCAACNDSLDDELFDKTVVFTKNGFQDLVIDFEDEDEVMTNLPISISGTSSNTQDVTVRVAVDNDTLDNYNFERFRNQTTLYYQILPESGFQLSSNSVVIPAGQEGAVLPLQLNIHEIDKFNEYVLPLRIDQTSAYNIGPSKYSKVLMRILFRNYFSGDYVVAGKVRDLTFNSEISLTNRTLKVVDENTCYLYAGNVDENANTADKEKFIIKAYVDPATNAVSLSALDTDIELEQRNASIERSVEFDPLNKNIEITTIKLNLTYRYKDITNIIAPPTMEFEGSMTLVKTRDISVWNNQ